MQQLPVHVQESQVHTFVCLTVLLLAKFAAWFVHPRVTACALVPAVAMLVDGGLMPFIAA